MQNSVTEISNSAPVIAPVKLTYDDFLRLHSGRHIEYVDGEVLAKMTVTRTHDNLTGFLNAILRAYVEARDLGRVYGDAFQMKLTFDGIVKGREPDVLFVAKANLGRVSERFLDGPADLAVEVVSSDSVTRDRVEKFAEYESAGVREYWIIEPSQRTAEFFGLDPSGVFNRLPISKDGVFESRVIDGLQIDSNWLWQNEMPHLIDVLRHWELI